MPANTTPIFGINASTQTASIAAANTASDGSGSLVTLFTPGANGSRVDSITFTNAQITAAASSAMVCRVFVTDTSGSNPRLLSEVAQATATRSVSAIGATQTISYGNGLLLYPGQLIKVCQSVYAGAQDLQHVVARGVDF